MCESGGEEYIQIHVSTEGMIPVVVGTLGSPALRMAESRVKLKMAVEVYRVGHRHLFQ